MTKSYVDKANELINLAKDGYFFWEHELTNNVPFYIFSYPAKDELKARKLAEEFSNEIESKGHKTAVINLYELILEILTEDWDFEIQDYIDVEHKNWFKFLIEQAIPGFLSDDIIESKFFEKAEWADIICVTWIWTAWPFLRAHLLLNRLEASNYVNKNKKVVFFYPWEYKKNEKWQRFLSLFSEFSEWGYYRATAICE